MIPASSNGLDRAGFLKALEAEGIANESGYTPLNKEPFLDRTINSRHYKRAFHDADPDNLPRPYSVPGQRSAVHRIGMVYPDVFSGSKIRYGSDCRRDPQDQEVSAQIAKA